MQNKIFVLGIDTSNYTTSLALTDDDGHIIFDTRKLLTVKQGERGLRQSDALFQHIENLPELVLDAFRQIDKDQIGAVAVSNRPRPVEGSYMPVFKAGIHYGKVMAASLGVPFFEFSHQEGHLAAVKQGSIFQEEKELLAYHLSGGTCELLHVKEDQFQILGRSKDISFGQVIDRVGVALGMGFPAGREMDQIAQKTRDLLKNSELSSADCDDEMKKKMKNEAAIKHLKQIGINGFDINLSGLETQCQRELEKGTASELLIYELFENMSTCLCRLTEKAIAETGCSRILFTGGVTASQFVRDEIQGYFKEKSQYLLFGNPALSSDNAVGISFLGGKRLWQSNQ